MPANDILKTWAFMRKEILTMLSYKFALVTSIVYPLITFGLFLVFASIFKKIINPGLIPYGGDFVAFIVIGSILWQFVTLGLYSISSTFREEMIIGTLETIFISPTNLLMVLVGATIVSLFVTTVFTVIVLAIGIGLFEINIIGGGYALALLILLLTFTSMLGIGIIIAGITLVAKSSGEIVGIIVTLMTFLSGVFYPVSVLPSWAQKIAAVIPLTHALDALRKALLVGTTFDNVSYAVWFLLVFSIVTIPLGYLAFNKCLKKVRKEGSLTYY